MTAFPISETAPAKLNLALHVRRRRADGYHDIETLFVFCRHGDLITVSDAQRDAFAITGPFAASLTTGGGNGETKWSDNLVTRAADAFRHAFGIDQRHAIVLEKHLPVASGIGGGSADAAATLRALARRHAIPLDEPKLLGIAQRLGADVPACLVGRTCFGTGKGDALAEQDGWRDTPVLLVNPGVAVPTGAVFQGWDGVDRGPLDPAAPHAGRNDLEAPARIIAPSIADVVSALAAQPGATLARMSGSGATCFALFDTPAERDAAEAALAVAHPGWWRLATSLA